MSGVTVLRMAKTASLASSYAVMRGGTTMAAGARRMATAMGMAERTPNRLTSYEAASTTPRRGCPAHDHGLAAQLGRIALLHRREERVHVEVDDGGGQAREETA